MITKEGKAAFVAELKELVKSNKSVGVLNMEKIPAALVLKVKTDLAGKVKIKMGRKTLIERALDESDKKGIKDVKEMLVGPIAIVFSGSNAFEMFKEVKTTKVQVAAKEGDVVEKDIVIPKGPTQIPPGPAISTLQKVGIKTQVQGGKLAIMNDTTVLKAGGTVTADVVSALNLLGIMPNEKSLNVSAILEDGIIYRSDVLDIDMEAFVADVLKCVSRSISLSLASGFLFKESAPLAVKKAFLEARAIALEANILTSDTADLVIAKAVRVAKAVEEKMKLESQSDSQADLPQPTEEDKKEESAESEEKKEPKDAKGQDQPEEEKGEDASKETKEGEGAQ